MADRHDPAIAKRVADIDKAWARGVAEGLAVAISLFRDGGADGFHGRVLDYSVLHGFADELSRQLTLRGHRDV